MKIKKRKKSIFDFFESIEEVGINIIKDDSKEQDLVYKIIFYSCFTVSNYRNSSDRFSLRITKLGIDPFIGEDNSTNKFDTDFGQWIIYERYKNLDLKELYNTYDFDEYSHILRKFQPNND